MQYARCKCGSHEVWHSGEIIATCRPCRKCGTVPAGGPNSHPEVTAHDFSMTETVQTDEGPKQLTRCRMCLRTKAQIEQDDAEEQKEIAQ